MEPTTKLINATRTVWNFQKPAWNVGMLFWWLGGNDFSVACLKDLFETVDSRVVADMTITFTFSGTKGIAAQRL